MKKAFYTLLFLASTLYASAQALSINEVKKQIQGTWLTHGDSICELLITADSITTFRFKAGGVSRCSYKLNTQPCDKAINFPAATGIYISENYKNTTICCSLAELTPKSFRVIYSNGAQITYLNESSFTKKQ